MAKHGKLGALDRWQRRELKGADTLIQAMCKHIQIAPLKNGCIACRVGDPNGANLTFTIKQDIVLSAAEAGFKYAEELKQKEASDAGSQASPQPAGG